MPVRDLTDRPRVPRAGKIRLGIKVPNASGNGEHPVAVPYFVCPPEVIEALGDEEPTELPIVFLDDDEELINSQWYRLYNFTHGRVCRGDGFTADALLDADVVKAREGDLTPNDRDMWAHGGTRGRTATQNVLSARIECLGAGYEGKPACPMYERGTGCSVKAFMQFAIRGVPQLAVYQLDTGSVIGIANVNGLIHQLKQLTGGRIAGIPLLLKRVPVQVREHGSMKMVSQQSITLELDPIVTRTNLLAIAAQPVARVLLPAPDESDAIEILADEEDDRSLAERTGHQVIEHEATQEAPVSASDGSTDPRVLSSPPAASPDSATFEQRASIAEWHESIRSQNKPGVLAAVGAWFKAAFPHVEGNLAKLKQPEADRYLRFLRHAAAGVLPEAGVDPEHDYQFNADATVLACKVCGLPTDPEALDTPAEEAAEVALPA